MFDIAFSEIALIMLVALVVIGPERLPAVARTVGRLWGRAQRFVNRVKSDIENEIAIDEARQMKQRIHQEIDAVGKTFREDGRTLEQHILQSQYSKQPAVSDTPPSSPAIPPERTH